MDDGGAMYSARTMKVRQQMVDGTIARIVGMATGGGVLFSWQERGMSSTPLLHRTLPASINRLLSTQHWMHYFFQKKHKHKMLILRKKR